MEQKTEVPGVYKVEEGVLINKDNASLQAYKNRKNRERKMIQIEADLELLKTDIHEIKTLLRSFVKI